MHDVKIDNTMGVNTWAAFAGSDDHAVVDGDFAVTEDELQAVLKSMVKNHINVVAIHQHMPHEQPRMMFFHYWGRGRAKEMAENIKSAFLIADLQEVSSRRLPSRARVTISLLVQQPVIRVYDDVGAMIEAHEQAGDSKSGEVFTQHAMGSHTGLRENGQNIANQEIRPKIQFRAVRGG